MSFIIYSLYNLFFQIALIGFLFYANTYLNSFFIPDSLRWKNGVIRDSLIGLGIAQGSILILESGILIFLIYKGNKWYLSNVAITGEPEKIANWTSGIAIVITVVWIITTTYLNF